MRFGQKIHRRELWKTGKSWPRLAGYIAVSAQSILPTGITISSLNRDYPRSMALVWRISGAKDVSLIIYSNTAKSVRFDPALRRKASRGAIDAMISLVSLPRISLSLWRKRLFHAPLQPGGSSGPRGGWRRRKNVIIVPIVGRNYSGEPNGAGTVKSPSM